MEHQNQLINKLEGEHDHDGSDNDVIKNGEQAQGQAAAGDRKEAVVDLSLDQSAHAQSG